jgi:hypothetical protein
MIESAIRSMLLAHAPLMALLGGQPGRVDLVDVAQTTAAPYLTYNILDGGIAGGRGSLCDPADLGLLTQNILLTPWAPTTGIVYSINQEARRALIGGRRTVEGVQIDSIIFEGFRAWAREPETNLLTRGQLLRVVHTE